MRKQLTVILFLSILLFSSCQKTPNETAVVGKQDIAIKSSAELTPMQYAVSQFEGLENWEEAYNTDHFNCSIDAEIVINDMDNIPVYMVQRREFTANDASGIINYFSSDATGVRIAGETKGSLTEELVMAKRGLVNSDENGNIIWIEEYEGKEERIAELEKRIAMADEEEYQPIDISELTIPLFNEYSLSDDTRCIVEINEILINVSSAYNEILQKQSWIADGGGIPGEEKAEISPIISEEDAVKILQEYIEDTELRGYSVSHVEKARLVNNYTDQIYSQGWCFVLSRDFCGYPVIDTAGNVSANGLLIYDNEYIERWHDERIEVYIDEDGIKNFQWTDPMEITETVSENAELLPFDTVKGYIKQYIKNGMSWMDGSSGKIEIVVQKIVLTPSLIPIKNDLEHQYVVPSWFVIYNFAGEENKGALPFAFAVNAMDGSLIDLSYKPNMQQ